MLSVILNIIGIILIIYSIYIINKDISKKKITSDDLNLMEERVDEFNEIVVESFDDIMESKLDIIETKVKNNNKSNYKKKLESEDIKIKSIVNDNRKLNIKENKNILYEKIIELKTIGLTNEEIAKKLNKGIREVEIILKMYENRN